MPDQRTVAGVREKPSSLVHGLVGSVAAETKLRNALLEVDQTDRVTVSIWDGIHIPFAGNTVNQFVCDKVTDEVRRALTCMASRLQPTGRCSGPNPIPKRWTNGRSTSIRPTATA